MTRPPVAAVDNRIMLRVNPVKHQAAVNVQDCYQHLTRPSAAVDNGITLRVHLVMHQVAVKCSRLLATLTGPPAVAIDNYYLRRQYFSGCSIMWLSSLPISSALLSKSFHCASDIYLQSLEKSSHTLVSVFSMSASDALLEK